MHTYIYILFMYIYTCMYVYIHLYQQIITSIYIKLPTHPPIHPPTHIHTHRSMHQSLCLYSPISICRSIYSLTTSINSLTGKRAPAQDAHSRTPAPPRTYIDIFIYLCIYLSIYIYIYSLTRFLQPHRNASTSTGRLQPYPNTTLQTHIDVLIYLSIYSFIQIYSSIYLSISICGSTHR